MISQHLEAAVLVTLHVAVVAGVGLRVVLARHAPGSAVAWILLTAVVPVVGVAAYALIGERPIGRRRPDYAREFFARLPAAVRCTPSGRMKAPGSARITASRSNSGSPCSRAKVRVTRR